MRGRLLAWARDWRHIWDELGRLEAEAKAPLHADLSGHLGEMGHPQDRADDWNAFDTGAET
jgi:hypothetical protein